MVRGGETLFKTAPLMDDVPSVKTIPGHYFIDFKDQSAAKAHFQKHIPISSTPPTIDAVHPCFVERARSLLREHELLDQKWHFPPPGDVARVPGCSFITLVGVDDKLSSSVSFAVDQCRSFCMGLALQSSSSLREAVSVGAVFCREAYIMRYVVDPTEPDRTGLAEHHDSSGRPMRRRHAGMILTLQATDLCGGDTVWTRADVVSRHTPGTLTTFWNTLRDGSMNDAAHHRTTPLTSGFKETLLAFFETLPDFEQKEEVEGQEEEEGGEEEKMSDSY